ncbi:MAG: ABC transporter ATP-binding protein [Eubacteriales bacterium]
MNTILRCENLYKTYYDKTGNVEAVRNVSLELEEGTCSAIIGRSGSGKSTLLHLLGGLEKPDSGSVYYKEKNIYQYSEDKLAVFRRRNIGFVFQQFNLIDEYTVLNNICMPLKLDGKQVDSIFLEEVIHGLGLEEKLEKYPHSLSGGEQQRVAIARSILAKPSIIFADEPTGNLDRKTAEETLELLFDNAKKYGQTLMLVTHDLEVARKADLVIRMEDL